MGMFLIPQTTEEVHEGKVRWQALVLDQTGKRLAECEHWHLKAKGAQRCAERLCSSATR